MTRCTGAVTRRVINVVLLGVAALQPVFTSASGHQALPFDMPPGMPG